ncbi:MAG: PrgI family protein, partial [Candidatus Saccharimonadales bacterium]
FLGPLTLKQFIFGASAIFFGYLGVYAVTQGAAFLLTVFAPPTLLGLFLAIPWNKDQPTEVWVLAKIRFRVKPRSRIWDQAGLEELVTITVPKVIEISKTDGLNQAEVQSRLKALADTIDTRGWATKNAGLNDHLPVLGDRLVSPSMIPRPVPEIDVSSYRDVLDVDTAVSENFTQMMQTSSQDQRRHSLEKMDRVRQGESIGSVQQPTINFTPPVAVGQPAPAVPYTSAEQALSYQLREQRDAGALVNSHMRTLSTHPAGELITAEPAKKLSVAAQPASTQSSSATDDVTAVEEPVKEAQAPMTKVANPAILDLAQNNDLDIATLARQAKRNDSDEDEVVITLR